MSGKAFKLFGLQNKTVKECPKVVAQKCAVIRGQVHRVLCGWSKGHDGDCAPALTCSDLHKEVVRA